MIATLTGTKYPDENDVFTGNQGTWALKTYPLDNYLGETNVIVRFRFTSDVYVEEEGMFINEYEVMVNGGTHRVELDVSGLPSGVYYGILENNGQKTSRKLVITR